MIGQRTKNPTRRERRLIHLDQRLLRMIAENIEAGEKEEAKRLIKIRHQVWEPGKHIGRIEREAYN